MSHTWAPGGSWSRGLLCLVLLTREDGEGHYFCSLWCWGEGKKQSGHTWSVWALSPSLLPAEQNTAPEWGWSTGNRQSGTEQAFSCPQLKEQKMLLCVWKCNLWTNEEVIVETSVLST